MRWLSTAGAMRSIMRQQHELKVHFDIAKQSERCYTACTLSNMHDDDHNQRFVPHHERVRECQCCLQKWKLWPLSTVFWPDIIHWSAYAQDCVTIAHQSRFARWDRHFLHVRACSLGTVFLDVLERPTCRTGKNWSWWKGVKTSLLPVSKVCCNGYPWT